jgi:hypothetical protein
MKAYIHEYEDNVADHSVLDVWFHSSPLCQWSSGSLAGVYSSVFNESGIHVEKHRCSFCVENLENGKFAIVCGNHPGLLAGRGDSRLLGARTVADKEEAERALRKEDIPATMNEPGQ